MNELLNMMADSVFPRENHSLLVLHSHALNVIMVIMDRFQTNSLAPCRKPSLLGKRPLRRGVRRKSCIRRLLLRYMHSLALHAQSRQATIALHAQSRQATIALHGQSRQATIALHAQSRQATIALHAQFRQATIALHAQFRQFPRYIWLHLFHT